MQYREVSRPVLLLVLVFLLLCGGIASRTLSAKNESNTQSASAFASPSPTPRNREEVPQDSDEVIKIETNLTNIFFTAADKNKRFISDLKAEDIRIFEDGRATGDLHFSTEHRSSALDRNSDRHEHLRRTHTA